MRTGRTSRGGFGVVSARARREAELFYADLIGRPARRGAFARAEGEDAEATPPPEWLAIAQRLPVTYTRPQMPMEPRILGVVVHTTNHGAGEETLERFQRDWQGLQFQSAHFAVDRAGNIGQYRSTREVAWHINEPSVRYFGIEHIAKHKQELTAEQLERSARLIGDLAVLFSFPARRLTAAGQPGIGIHVDFKPTGCGQNVFWVGTTGQRTPVFDRLVARANDYATLGY
ncbi:MAG TPA: peptidoglycan recognition family protein [Vicinamibacterales bacterium]|nr:peptidoglycan recognition family protein [Vicinamibacterales bacterium]